MAGITGMEVARKIREQDTHCQLIFTTTTGEFAVDSYEVGAAYYLVNAFSYENLTQWHFHAAVRIFWSKASA